MYLNNPIFSLTLIFVQIGLLSSTGKFGGQKALVFLMPMVNVLLQTLCEVLHKPRKQSTSRGYSFTIFFIFVFGERRTLGLVSLERFRIKRDIVSHDYLHPIIHSADSSIGSM
jgi:hypothetical protein